MDILITPYRWYDKYHKQNRFDRECNNSCEFKLITPRNSLLPFQFTRPASPYGIDKWLLRPACEAYEPTVLTANDSKFIDDFNWDYTNNVTFDCSIAKIGSSTLEDPTVQFLKITNSLTINTKYRITFCVVDLNMAVGSLLSLKFFNGVTAIITGINSLGFYEAEFTANSTDFSFIGGSGSTGEYIGITDVQLYEVFTQQSFDIELDETLIFLYNIGDVDYFVYCGADLGQVLPTGEYYSIIVDDNEEKYFSEVITVKNFLPQKSPYYILKWENTCDINNVLYQDIDCDYFNLLYLDEAIITKPDYPFAEEGEEDGNQTFNATFQKWEKKQTFIVGKCPEFIVDALTAIRLHNTIEITSPLRKKQLVVDDAVSVKSVEYEVLPIFNDCFSNVELKLLLNDKYVDASCCENNSITPCIECDNPFQYYNELPVSDVNEGEYAVLTEQVFIDDVPYPPGLYQWDGMQWVEVDDVSDDSIWCINIDEDELVFICILGVFYQIPSIYDWGTTSFWFVSPTPHFHIEGYAYPNSYVQVEISTDGGLNWTKDSQIVSDGVFAVQGIDIPYVDDDNLVYVRIHNFTLNCDYGYSEAKQINMVGDFNNDFSSDFFN